VVQAINDDDDDDDDDEKAVIFRNSTRDATKHHVVSQQLNTSLHVYY